MTGGYYAIIPGNILDDPDLSASEKIMYAEISALANRRGFCWASNDFFAAKFNASKRSVARWMSSMKSKGYIRVETSGPTRRIYIGENPFVMVEDPYSEEDDKNDTLTMTKMALYHDKNGTHSIKDSNTDSNTLLVVKSDSDMAKTVGKALMAAFKSKTTITNQEYPREAKAARDIADRIVEIFPQNAQEGTGRVLSAFWYLVTNGDGFWRQQSFRASTLQSVKMWGRIMKHMQQDVETIDDETAEFLEDVWKA